MAFRTRSFKQRPVLPFLYDDWRSSPRVQAMTREQRTLYLELLIEQWDRRQGSLPADVPALAAVVRMRPQTFAKHWPVLAPCFVKTKRGRLRNPKLALIRAAQRQWQGHQRAISTASEGTSRRNQLTAEDLGTYHRSVPNLTTEKSARRRAQLASARDAYLAQCPHTPRCTKAQACGHRRDLEAAVADGRVTPEAAARLVTWWAEDR